MTNWVFLEKKNQNKKSTFNVFIVKPVSNLWMWADNWIILRIFAILKYELLNNEEHWNVKCCLCISAIFMKY